MLNIKVYSYVSILEILSNLNYVRRKLECIIVFVFEIMIYFIILLNNDFFFFS